MDIDARRRRKMDGTMGSREIGVVMRLVEPGRVYCLKVVVLPVLKEIV